MNSKYCKESVRKLLAEGRSQRSIAIEMSGQQFGSEFESARAFVRRIAKKHSTPNTFEETLEESNFSLPEGWEYGWLKTKKASVFIKNQGNDPSFEDMRAEFITALKGHSPDYKTINRVKSKDPHLLVVDIADLHIGKLGAESQNSTSYNVDIAIQRATEGVQGILDKTIGFDIDKILFVVGNDVLHTDNSFGTTTRGTKQDTDGMWFDNYKRARALYVGIIEMLLNVADVHIVHNPSNHDYVTGFMLADSLFAWFRNSENVTFDITNAHRKYFQYGMNLIGTSHGDGAKMDEMPLLMANEAKVMWAETEHRYIYLHHIHHKQDYRFAKGRDYNGVNVEYLRSPSSADDYHHKQGYTHAPKAIEGFVHHKEFGQVARVTHLFR
jgi:hypothetical protein